MTTSIKEALELLPCPFCGSAAEIERGNDHHGEWFNLGCSCHWGNVEPDSACPAGRMWYTAEPEDEPKAIATWNTRAALATLQPSGERREAIARAVRSVLMDGLESNDPGNWLVPMYADDIGDLCRHVADALIASGLVQDEAGWRDISTAPKDGTRIFVRRDNGYGTDYMVVWWDDTNNDGYPWQSDNNAYVEDRWDEWMLPPTRSARDGGEE